MYSSLFDYLIANGRKAVSGAGEGKTLDNNT